MKKCCEDTLISILRTIENDSDDTVWLTKMETMFDRLVSDYKNTGGDMSRLKIEFPQYPVCGE